MLDELCRFTAPNVFNPWRDSDPLDTGEQGASHRLARLAQHFNCTPRFLLIGEAPGYQGCHFSGVPFTNERLLLDGVVPRVPCQVRITRREPPWSEPSATVVWGALHKLAIAEDTVMWNAFPFHPHKPGEPMSNRKPTNAEVRGWGGQFLRAVIEKFHGAKVVAVGRVAESAIRYVTGKSPATVRHPSMGGANEFRAGIAVQVGGG